MGLDRYRLRTQVGAGVDGISYKGASEDGQSPVEIRELIGVGTRPDRWRQLARRLRQAAMLDHPGALRILELDTEHEPPFAILEWAGSPGIGPEIRRALPMPPRKAVEQARGLASVLAAAHRLGLVHGRVEAEQIYWTETTPRLDFTGLETRSPAETLANVPVHPLALSTIVGEEPTDPASDVLGLGRLLAWLSSGLPFTDGRKAADELALVDPGLGRLLLSMIAEDPQARPTAREVAERLLLPPPPAGTIEPKDSDLHSTTGFISPISRSDETLAASTSRVAPAHAGPEQIGRFRLLAELGRGGQGVVYRAEDLADGSIVALKVLTVDVESRPEVLRRFRKEARMLAEVNNPFVVNLREFNDEDEVPYLVMEFVTGINLGDLLESRDRLDEPTALAIMADVARGLSQAHDRGIVHRDIKPSNILLTDARTVSPEATAGETPRDEPASGPGPTGPERWRVKLSDFGLARHVVDSQSMAVTAAGAIVGTPHYMAPEQCTARPVDPRTDVYAMGATLFHMLAGRPPFNAKTREEVYAQHCHTPPPPLDREDLRLSEGLCRLVSKAMAKAPEDRYADAGDMLRDLDRLLRGEPTGIPMHPVLPDCDPDRILDFEFRWELTSAPRLLWPHVTNTDRLDRAIGFAPVRYTSRFEPGRGTRVFLEDRKAGMSEAGEEFPYEWVEPRRMGILREYREGPFVWLISAVELIPRGDGGTTLVHRLKLEPRTWKIRFFSPWGIGVRLRDSLGRVYQRIDAALAGKLGFGEAADPFEPSFTMHPDQRQRLDERLECLENRGADPAVVERLGELLAHSPAQELARLRPLALARRWGLDPDAVVSGCLHATREGLLVLLWDLICPACRIPSEVKETLREIRDHGHCNACNLDFELDFAGSVELIFRAHPEVREADTATYCIGGPAHSPHVLAQVRVAGGERIELELALAEGNYRLRGPQLPWSADFKVGPTAPTRRWDIDLVRGPEQGSNQALKPGSQVLALFNERTWELLVRVERATPREDALTAARASSLALFRDLFPGEILSPGQLVSIASVTLLATDLERSDRLYQELGDARTFGLIYEHFRLLGEQIRQEGGAVVKTVGDGLLAAFHDPEAAVRTALNLHGLLADSEVTRELALKVAVHRGPAMAATVNDQLDYFGTTVRVAWQVLGVAAGGQVVVTQSVAGDPRVLNLLRARGLEGEIVPPGSTGLAQPLLRLAPLPR